MKVVGHVESLWRYPVKSMRGEQLSELFLDEPGVVGDRIYAFHYSAAPETFPYLTARQKPEMLLYRATYHPSGILVDTPGGDRLAINDSRLIELLSQGFREGESLSLLVSERAMTDAHPVSLLSLQTTGQLSEELGSTLDKLRFRANLYVTLDVNQGFAEDEFVGRKLMIGSTAVIDVIERDPRCKIITLDPDTTTADPNVMRQVARAHQGNVGVYASVLVKGAVRSGDEVSLLPA